MIFCTGSAGSIGCRVMGAVGEPVIKLQTRLESTAEEMLAEIKTHSREQGLARRSFLHLAAMTSVQECEKDPERAFRCNVDGAMNWLRAAADAGLQRFVFVSTGHVFRPTEELEWLGVNRIPDATAIYGRSKAMAEERLRLAARESGIELVIARVFSVIGKGMRPGFLYPELERRARERDFRPLPGYRNVRDFIDAGVAAERLVHLTRADSAGGVYHVCTGVPRTVRDLAIQVFKENGLANESDFASLFPESNEVANYLVSKPNVD